MGDFKCTLCGATFGDVEELQDHIKDAHGGAPDEENFECSICGQRFESAADLESHMSGAHPS
ncbi:MAG: C2H2-type zinc finger protein [Candidatus Micrarchaeaceae archaeon]|jgi:uncharacterized C2H2 Zn-finger protein